MTFKFDSDGFLTSRSGELEANIENAFGSFLTRARQINRDCHELIFAADVRNRDVQGLLVATLFMRVLEHYQATLILLTKGLVAPSKAALRTLMETVFRVRAVADDRDAMRGFIDADLLHRKKFINKARQFAEPREAIADSLIKELEDKIKVTGAKEISIEELSKIAGLHDWYISAYAMLSKATHSQVSELDTYLKLGGSSEVREIIYAPSMDEIPHLIITAAHCIVMAALAVDKTFSVGYGTKGDEQIKLMEAAFQILNSRPSS